VNRINSRLLSVVLLSSVACTPDADAPPEGMSPRDRLESAVAAWNSTSAFHFALQLDGRSIQLDQSGLLSFNQVEGDVVAPDRMQAETTVRTPVGNTQVAFIAIGDEQWLTNPLTRQWEPAPPEASQGVAGMFDPNTGIGSMLIDMDDLQQVGEETVAGVRTARLTGKLPGAVLSNFAPDLAGVQTVDVDLWIGVDDHRIRQILVREPPVGDAAPASWTFQFSRLDEPISIQPPS
jgi:hypothetical protein